MPFFTDYNIEGEGEVLSMPHPLPHPPWHGSRGTTCLLIHKYHCTYIGTNSSHLGLEEGRRKECNNNKQ